jgi:hypothetical protein
VVKRDKNGRFVKGETGNPAGRPVGGRAFTEILRARGEHKSKYPPHSKRYRLESREVLAAQLWEAVTTGKITLSDGKELEVKGMDEWFAVAKWIYQQVDGPPKLQADINAQQDGEVRVTFVNPYLDNGEDNEQ